MNDDFLSKVWADNHGSLAADVDKLVRIIGRALRRLNAIQYDRPWQRDTDATAPIPAIAAQCTDG